MAGQSLELFFVDGKPDGMLTAEIFNWTGHVLVAPRTQLPEMLRRKEAAYTGVYVLLGEDAESSLPKAYIGEADDVAARIRNHDAERDWWTSVVIITSSANSLNKAHVKYLESRLVKQVKVVATLKLENKNSPPRPTLSESATANMEQFLEHLHVILPALRVDGFLNRKRQVGLKRLSSELPYPATPAVKFEIRLENGEVHGYGTLKDGEFIVLPGSRGRGRWIGADHNYSRLFDEVVESGVYKGDDTARVFDSAYAFPSPSAAGAVLNGRSTAGPIAWKLAGSLKTYKDWEADQL